MDHVPLYGRPKTDRRKRSKLPTHRDSYVYKGLFGSSPSSGSQPKTLSSDALVFLLWVVRVFFIREVYTSSFLTSLGFLRTDIYTLSLPFFRSK